jgi:hypothetical protein
MKKYTYIIAAAVILGSVSFSFSSHALAIETGTTWTGIFGRPSIGNGSSGASGATAAGASGAPAAGASGVQAAGASGAPAGGFSNITGGNSGGAAAGSDNLLPNPIKASNIQDLIYLIVNIVTYIGMILAILALIWVGFKFIAAQGNSEKLKDARKEFLYVVIGIAILIGAAAITDIIKTTLTSAGVVDSSFFTTTGR